MGKITDITLTASIVKLITAYDSHIGIILKEADYVDIMKGQGSWNQSAVVEYIPIEADITIGEEVFTSGESDIYPQGLTPRDPAGIYIGKVVGISKSITEEFFKTLYVKPELTYTKIKDVFILDWNRD